MTVVEVAVGRDVCVILQVSFRQPAGCPHKTASWWHFLRSRGYHYLPFGTEIGLKLAILRLLNGWYLAK